MTIIYKISDRLVLELTKTKTINIHEAEYYKFCIEHTISEFLYIFIVLLIGCLFHCFNLAICYLISLPTIKRFTGGAHASNESICFIISYTIPFVCIFLSSRIRIDSYLHIIIYFICCIFIIYSAPIDNKNKRLNRQKKKRLKYISLFYLLYISFLYSCFIYFNLVPYYNLITLCIIIITIDQIIGTIINGKDNLKL